MNDDEEISVKKFYGQMIYVMIGFLFFLCGVGFLFGLSIDHTSKKIVEEFPFKGQMRYLFGLVLVCLHRIEF